MADAGYMHGYLVEKQWVSKDTLFVTTIIGDAWILYFNSKPVKAKIYENLYYDNWYWLQEGKRQKHSSPDN